MTGSVQRVKTPDGIEWHTETFSNKSAQEYVVLIPSGEGDCGNLTQVANMIASNGSYNVLTFDMPGFSRSTAPREAYEKAKPQTVVKQIVGLLDTLNIQRASFFGCSSGGGFVLALCALYPSRVKCGIAHEVPFAAPENWLPFQSLSDEEIVATCTQVMGAFIEGNVNDGKKKWEALGSEYHARIAGNFVTWTKEYVGSIEAENFKLASDPENLQRRPIFWTVGSLNENPEAEGSLWKSDFELASKAGLTVHVDKLNSLHFPSVTVPEQLAAWIDDCVRSVKD